MHAASQDAWEEELYPLMARPILAKFAQPRSTWRRLVSTLAAFGHPLAALEAARKLAGRILKQWSNQLVHTISSITRRVKDERRNRVRQRVFHPTTQTAIAKPHS